MAKIDVSDVKKKILSFLDQNGPSLPIPIAKHVLLQPMFASAILSELLNEKRVKTSSMKIGSSPLYLIPGQEAKLDAFTENLTGVEKEAYIKLKDNKFLEDQTQEPRLRVALRGLKDFAIPIQMNNKLYWKYFTSSSEKIKQALEDEGEIAVGERVVGQQIWEDIKKEQPKVEPAEIKTKQEKIVHILTTEAENTSKQVPLKIEKIIKEEVAITREEPIEVKQTKIKKLTEKDLFLEQVKRILESKNIEILEIIQFDKKQVIAKARVNVDKTCVLFFMDKKRPDEKDLARAYKKSQEYKLPYYIVTQTQPQKKLKETADLYKALLGFGSIE
jgi:hypothetical protein